MCGVQNSGPKGVQALPPDNLWLYYYLPWQRDFADVIDSVDLEMRNLWGSSVVMWALRSGELAVVEGAVTMEKGSEQCRTAGFDDGGRGREPRDVGASRSWKTAGKRKETEPLLELPETALGARRDIWLPQL